MGAFEPGKALTMMADHHVTHMFASPSLLASLARHPAAGQHDWRDVQSIMVGGAPITDATALLAPEVFGDILFQVFGQTEAVPLAAMGPEDWFSDIEGSVPLRAAGRVAPFAEVEIRGPDGTVLPVGAEGEIVAKVEGQMRGSDPWSNYASPPSDTGEKSGLRHTAATTALIPGVHPKVVSERHGHASTQITGDRYTHVLESVQEAAADAIGRFLRSE
jgi:acyl-CoA synthetase (AMP-forming)/AMP-acid ligase II